MRRKISSKDKEIILALKIIQKTMGGLMANLQDAQNAIAGLSTALNDLVTKVGTFQTEATNAFNRLDQKIADLQAQVNAGTDTQPLLDAIAPLNQSVTDTNAALDPAIAAAQVEGQ